MIYFGHTPIWVLRRNLIKKDLHFRNRRVCDCIVVFTFYTRTSALTSNYLHHHQLYTESQCKNLLFIYIHGTFRQKIFHQMEPINIYWDHFTPHIVYWRDRNQATSSTLNADTILYKNLIKRNLHALSFVSRNQPKIWCSSVCVLIINVRAWASQ